MKEGEIVRRIEKETLEIINNYKNEKYLHYKKLIEIRKNELKEELQKDLDKYVLKEKIEEQIEKFKNKYNFKVSVEFNLSIRSYYTDYEELYNNDELIREYKINMQKIEKARNRMKLILQNAETKSEEYQKIIRILKKGE